MKLNCKKIFACLCIFAFLILATNAAYAAVDFSLNQTSVVLNDGTSFEFQIRISDIDADARSFSGSMSFNDSNIRIDSIVGLGSNWQLEGRNLSLGTFYMTRVNDEAASSNEAVLKVTGSVLANQCEETITITDLRYMDINDVQLSAGRVLGFFVKKNASTIDLNVSDDNYQSGGQSIFDIIDMSGSTQGNNNNNNNDDNGSNGSLIPEDTQTPTEEENSGSEGNKEENVADTGSEGNKEENTAEQTGNNSSNAGNTTGNTNGNTDNKTNSGTAKKDTTVTPANQAPQTGTGKFVVIALVSIVVIGSVCYVGFRKNNF